MLKLSKEEAGVQSLSGKLSTYAKHFFWYAMEMLFSLSSFFFFKHISEMTPRTAFISYLFEVNQLPMHQA